MKKLVRIMWIPVLVIMLYTGWILWQRHLSLQPVPPAPTQDPLAKYGRRVTIVQFYASNAMIAPGEKSLLCYGVVNAKEVHLDPPVEKVWPAASRCFDVAPSSTTHYSLTAEGPDHQAVSASLDITVGR